MLHESYLLKQFHSVGEGIKFLEENGYRVKKITDVFGHVALPAGIPDEITDEITDEIKNHPLTPGSEKFYASVAFLDPRARLTRSDSNDPIILGHLDYIEKALEKAPSHFSKP